MTSNAHAQEIRLTIPSRLDYLGIVNQAITELGECFSLEEEIVDALAIAVIEAGTNAIQHGSEGEGENQVDFRISVEPDAVRVNVQDEGPGFNVIQVAEASEPNNILRSRGRGIFLMRTFMDKVDFVFPSTGGTTVQLLKRRKPAQS